MSGGEGVREWRMEEEEAMEEDGPMKEEMAM